MTSRTAMCVPSIACLVLAIATTIVQGQCGSDFSDKFNSTTFQFAPTAMVTFDDGSGPAIYVTIGGVFVNLAPLGAVTRWRGGQFESVGNVAPSALALAVHDDGSGPALYAAGGFVSAGGASVHRVAKWNGTSWSQVGSGIDNGSVQALASYDDGSGPKLYAAGQFSLAGGVPCTNIARWNGTAWSAVATSMTGPVPFTAPGLTKVAGMAVADVGQGPRLFVTGVFGAIDGVAAQCVASYDGATWSPLGAGVGAAAVPNPTSICAYDSGTGPEIYVAGAISTAGGSAAAAIARWNGTSWSPLGAGLTGYTAATSMRVWNRSTGSVLVVAGSFASAGGIPGGMAFWDGTAWQSANAAGRFFSSATNFDAGNGDSLYAAGNVTVTFPNNGGSATTSHFFQRYDGTSWSTPNGQGFTGGGPAAMVAHDDGNGTKLFAGGSIGSAGAQPLAHVGAWDGAQWSVLGSGLATSASAMASGDIGNGPRVFAGGSSELAIAGGVVTSGSAVRAWNGTSWDLVGQRLSSGTLNALGMFDLGAGAALYAGTTFNNSGTNAVNGVGRWNGTAWEQLGLGMGASSVQLNGVHALATFDDGSGTALYAGGLFQTAGGVAANNVAKWDGANWSPVGSGLTGPSGVIPVKALAVFDDGTGPALYAGGQFTSAGGIPAVGLARWNGSQWTPVGGGVALPGGTPAVFALKVFDDGNGPRLYVGGAFSLVGNVATNCFARWDGQNWTAFGSGLVLPGGAPGVSYVAAFAEADLGRGRTLFIGGSFALADATNSFGIAELVPRRPSIAITQPAGGGTGAFIACSGLVSGREYFDIFSADVCGVAGSGPYLGLCATDPSTLLAQFALPLGVAPFHFAANGSSVTFGPFGVPAGITVDAVSFDFTAGQLGCVSTVVRYTTQ